MHITMMNCVFTFTPSVKDARFNLIACTNKG